MNSITKICKIEGCNQKHRARGWCKVHYQKWYDNGDPYFKKPVLPKFCSIEGCEKPRQPGRKGWCETHYGRWYANGDPFVTKIDRSIPGATKLSEYKSWQGMKERCLKPHHKSFERYGGRGITMYEPWVKSFRLFYEYMGDKPTPAHSIERKDNSKGYEPGNVKWATKKEQASNRRSNLLYTLNDQTKTLKQWCEYYNLNYKTVHARIHAYGWSINEALELP